MQKKVDELEECKTKLIFAEEELKFLQEKKEEENG